MIRYRAVAAFVGPAVLLLAACSTRTDNGVALPAVNGTTTPHDTGRAVATRPLPPPVIPGSPVGAKLTAACPVLTASEVVQVLGNGQSTTRITATEGTPDDSQADKIFECDYGVGGNAPFTLALGNITESDFSASDAVTAFVQQAKAKPQPVPHLGTSAAYFPLPTGDAMLAMAKRSHGELRTATFEAPRVVPVAKLAQLMALVADRL